MTTTKSNLPFTAISLTLCLLSASCHVSATKVLVPGSPQTVVIPEVEVNDFAFAPQFIGTVIPGDQIFIEGSITDAGWDPRDGFQLFADVPMIVSVSLNAHNPGVDLDWCIWDPTVGNYTVCAETEFNPEMGSFIVVPPGNEFHVVVSSYSGTSTYTMELTFSAYFAAELSETDREAEVEFPTPRAERAMEYGDPETLPYEGAPSLSAHLIDFGQGDMKETSIEFLGYID
jgi:hypothetical protein